MATKRLVRAPMQVAKTHHARQPLLPAGGQSEGKGKRPSRGLQMTWRLNSLVNSRKILSRLIREYTAGKIEDGQAKTLGYLMSTLLAFFREESNADIVTRIESIERQLADPSKTAAARMRLTLAAQEDET